MTLEEQAKRSYEQYLAQPDDLARNTFLAALEDRNQILYYKLLATTSSRCSRSSTTR